MARLIPRQSGEDSRAAPRIGVAISGGGHRASLWGLGGLMALVDSGLNASVTTVTSVSGGSITNAVVALADKSFCEFKSDEFRELAADIMTEIAGRPRFWITFLTTYAALPAVWLVPLALDLGPGRTLWFPTSVLAATLTVGALAGPFSGGCLWSWWGTWVYLGMLPPAVTGVAAVFWLPVEAPLRATIFLAALVAFALLAWFRNVVAGFAIGHFIGKTRSHAASLEDMQYPPRHVICATELHAAGHVYFTKDLVYCFGFGIGVPGNLPIRTAVQASSSYPGAFPIRILRTSKHRFLHPRGICRSRWMVLSDGGVHDNLADSWFNISPLLEGFRGVAFRARNREGTLDGKSWLYFEEALNYLAAESPEQIIVLDASVPFIWQGMRRVWLPGLGEILGLLKAAGVLYQSAMEHRAEMLERRFLNSFGVGAIIRTDHSPFDWGWGTSRHYPETFGQHFPDQMRRARHAADALSRLALRGNDRSRHTPPNVDVWAQIIADTREVGTSFNPMGKGNAVRLLYHAYVQTKVNNHVFLGVELGVVPGFEEFKQWLGVT